MLKKTLIPVLFIGFLFVNIIPSVNAYDFRGESGLDKTAIQTGHQNLTKTESLPQLIGKIISIFLSFLGVIFLLLMIYSGYTWMTARGNEQQVEKAKSIIKNALFGLIVVLSAYAITTLF